MIITGDTIISDVLGSNPHLSDVLFEAGMHCAGCPSARMETISEACEVHGLDLQELLDKLNKR